MGIGKGTGRGGARPGAGKPKGAKTRWPMEVATEIRGLREIITRLDETARNHHEVVTRLNEIVRNEHEALQPIHRRLVAIERALEMREPIRVPRVSRRRPLGVE